MKEDKKGLELLAGRIEEELQAEETVINYDDVEIPQEYHEKMLQFVRALDKKTAEKEKKKRRQRMLRTAAVFLVTFVTVNAA
ncbi:MAG: hypothetical protein IJB73_05345, partial [Firmicutes bacterium]|nr:hypothetical protein [Bacillota bacterium]